MGNGKLRVALEVVAKMVTAKVGTHEVIDNRTSSADIKQGTKSI